MVRIAGVLLIIAGFIACAADNVYYHTTSWEAACSVYPVSCEGVTPPKVVYKDLGEDYLGRYNGSDTIWIRQGLRGEERMQVLVHETIHYLQVQLSNAVIPGTAFGICVLEDNAFLLTDQWLDIVDRSDDKTGDGWWLDYPMCWQFVIPTEE